MDKECGLHLLRLRCGYRRMNEYMSERISVAGLCVLGFVFQNTSEQGSLPDGLCFRCPKTLSCSCLLRKEDFICLLPVISAAKNEPGVRNKSQHLNIPNYQGGTHLCCHSKAGNKHTINSADRMPTDKPPGSRKAKAVVPPSLGNSS